LAPFLQRDGADGMERALNDNGSKSSGHGKIGGSKLDFYCNLISSARGE
jgi:hypothetical protein